MSDYEKELDIALKESNKRLQNAMRTCAATLVRCAGRFKEKKYYDQAKEMDKVADKIS